MRGQDHLTFGEFGEFLARSLAKVAGVPQVVGDEAAAPPVAADEAAAHPGISGLVRKLEDPPMRSVRAVGLPRLALPKAAVPIPVHSRARSVPWAHRVRSRARSVPWAHRIRSKAHSVPWAHRVCSKARSVPWAHRIRSRACSVPWVRIVRSRAHSIPWVHRVRSRVRSVPGARSVLGAHRACSVQWAHRIRSRARSIPGAHRVHSVPEAQRIRSVPGAHRVRSVPWVRIVRSLARSIASRFCWCALTGHQMSLHVLWNPRAFRPSIDRNTTDTFKAQKGSKDIIKIMDHLQFFAQPYLIEPEYTDNELREIDILLQKAGSCVSNITKLLNKVFFF